MTGRTSSTAFQNRLGGLFDKLVALVARLHLAAGRILRVAIEPEADLRKGHILAGLRARPAQSVEHAPDITTLHRKVTEIFRARRRRDRHFPAGLFGEPAWDMLLELFAARLSDRQLTMSSACDAASVSTATALRWLSILEKAGLVECIDHPHDDRVRWVQLSEVGFDRLHIFFEDLIAGTDGGPRPPDDTTTGRDRS